MTLEYLLPEVRKLNPVMDEPKKETLGFISDISYNHVVGNDVRDEYRSTLDNQSDRACYDNELKLVMGAAA